MKSAVYLNTMYYCCSIVNNIHYFLFKILLSIEAQFRHIKLLFKYQNILLMFDVTFISSITITRTRILMFAFYYSSLYNSIKDTFLIFVLETNKTITNDANPMPIQSGKIQIGKTYCIY